MSLIKLNFFYEKYSGHDLGLDLSSRNFPVSISVLVSKKFYCLGLGLGLESCRLDDITTTTKTSCKELMLNVIRSMH